MCNSFGRMHMLFGKISEFCSKFFLHDTYGAKLYVYNQPATISNGNRTEWSPIRSVIIRVITKSDDRAAGVRFVYHEYDYRPNWTTRSSVTN